MNNKVSPSVPLQMDKARVRQIMRCDYELRRVRNVTMPFVHMSRLVLEYWMRYRDNNEFIGKLSDTYNIYMPVVLPKRDGYKIQFVIGGFKVETFFEYTCRLPMTTKRLVKVSDKVSKGNVW